MRRTANIQNERMPWLGIVNGVGMDRGSMPKIEIILTSTPVANSPVQMIRSSAIVFLLRSEVRKVSIEDRRRTTCCGAGAT